MPARNKNPLRTLWRWLPRILGVAILGLIIFWMSYGFGTRVPPGGVAYERPAVGSREVVTVMPLSTVETISAVGTVRPRRKAEVASQILATIRQIEVNPGDVVQPGQLLVTLDDRDFQAQLRAAEAAVNGVRADFAVRQRDYARYQRMLAEGAVTREDYDRVEGAYQVTQAQLERAQQQLEQTEVLLSYTQVEAQQGGIVSDRFADPGDLAAPGKPLLAIHDPQELELHANVRETLASHLKLAMKLRVTVESANLDTEGTVREIVPQAEAASRTVLVKVALPSDRTDSLYIGTFGRLEIPVGQLDRIVVDARAVQTIGQLEVVDVVVEQDQFERRFIRVGQHFDNLVEVLSGLRVDERVALPELPSMSEAARVQDRGA